MEIEFELGNKDNPKGHAVAYFRNRGDSTLLATYLIVPPIKLNLTKYIPPMFAGKVSDADVANLSFVAIPPIAEQADSYEQLRAMAETRDDDLIFAGSVDATRPEELMLTTNEAARLYGELYKQSSAAKSIAAPEEHGAQEALDVQEVLYELMSERDRLGELAKLAGKLRYAVEGSDNAVVRDTIREINALGQFLAEKYKVDDLIAACEIPGPRGAKLASLYLDRCYRLYNEEYGDLARIDAEIKDLSAAS